MVNTKNIINSKMELGVFEIKNRLVFQPMEGCDGTANGSISELTKRRYMRFAESGAGIIWFEAVAVCEEGRANPRQLMITEDNVLEYKKLLAEIRNKAYEVSGFYPIIIMQATHSGRYSKPHGTAAPIIAYRSAVFEKGKEKLPYVVASDDYLDKMPAYYAKSAKLALDAGFDGIDVKCCHGYLLCEMLSAYSREGKYGGSFTNRTRLFLDCVDAARNMVEDKMLVTSRLSAYDGFDYPYGFGVDRDNKINLTETKELIGKLLERGVELINITIGNPYLIPSVNRPYVGSDEDGMVGVARVVGITAELQNTFPNIKLVMSALTFPGVDAISYANQLLADKKAMFVGFGRMTFAYPKFYKDYLLTGALDKNQVCIKCGNCSKMMRAGGVAGCPIRDGGVYMPLYKKYVEGKDN